MKKAALAVLLAGMGLAQNPVAPEIRGRVIDSGLNAGLPGAQVTVVEILEINGSPGERRLATLFTDANGGFAYKPGHLGNFRVDVEKAGYQYDLDYDLPSGTLTPEQPSMDLKFLLVRPASLTGRILDEDGNPMKGLRLRVEMIPDRGPTTLPATNEEGVFSETGLFPGRYLVHVGPEGEGSAIDFSLEAFHTIDQDFKSAFWPGDSPNRKSALPLRLNVGESINLGTITVHKTDYYRVHGKVANCESGDEPLSYHLFQSDREESGTYFRVAPCGEDAILPMIERGSHILAVSVKRGGSVFWSMVPFEVTDKNVQVEMSLSPSIDFRGHFVLPDGPAVPSLRTTRILLHPDPEKLAAGDSFYASKPDGTFAAPQLPWARYLVGVLNVPQSHYVKEIRYGGRVVIDGFITLSKAAELEIVLDDHPGSVSGTVTDFEQRPIPATVVVRKRGVQSEAAQRLPQNSAMTRTDEQGRFTIGGLAPGDYEIEAFVVDPRLGISADLLRHNPRAETVTLERGDRKSVELKVGR